MTARAYGFHSDLMTGAIVALGSVAAAFFLIGLFIGWAVWADEHVQMPTACSTLTTASDCAARMSEAR